MTTAQDLLDKPRTEGDRESFTYYKKEKPIPLVGDILHIASYFDSCYIVVYKVVIAGTHYSYYGHELRQRDLCGFSPPYLRETFEATGRRLVFNPKNAKYAVMEILPV